MLTCVEEKCTLFGTKPVDGDGPLPTPIMLIGESPGETEHYTGKPFQGRAGAELDNYLYRAGLNRYYCYVTNLIKCHPPKNRNPKNLEISCCTSYLIGEIINCNPIVVGTLGAFSTKFLLGDVSLEYVHGIPYEIDKLPNGMEIPRILVVPCYHPALGLRKTEMMSHTMMDFRVLAGVYKGEIGPREPNPSVERDYKLITDPNEIEEMPEVAIDTESVDFRLPGNPSTGSMWCITYSTAPNMSRMIMAKDERCIKRFAEWVRDPAVICDIHNAPYDLPVLKSVNVTPATVADTMTMAYLLQTEPKGLKPLAYRHLNIDMQEYDDVVGVASTDNALVYLLSVLEKEWPDPEPVIKWEKDKIKIKQPSNIQKRVEKILSDYDKKGDKVNLYKRWKGIKLDEGRAEVEEDMGPMPPGYLSNIPFEDAFNYAAQDADVTFQVKPILWKKIVSLGLEDTFWRDMRAMPMVSEMRMNGMRINKEHLSEFSANLSDRLDMINGSIDFIIRGHLNPASPKQVLELLLKRNVFKKGDKITTDAKYLKKHRKQHVLVDKILNWRELSKLKGTYADSLPKKADLEDRVRTNISMTTVVTGRLCIAKGTKILIVGDSSKYPDGKPIEDIRKRDLVYCYNDDLKPTIRKVKWSGRTGYKEVIRLHWKSRGNKYSGYLDLTPDHKVRLVNGKYIRAKDLVGDLRSPNADKRTPKISVLSASKNMDRINFTGCSRQSEHRFVYKTLFGSLNSKDHVHHKNRNHFDNTPSNLLKLTSVSHPKIHAKNTILRPDIRAKNIEIIKDNWKSGKYKNAVRYGEDNPNYLNLSKYTCLRLLAKAGGKPTKVNYDFDTFKRYLSKYDISVPDIRLRYDKYGKYISKGKLKRISNMKFLDIICLLGKGYYQLESLFSKYDIKRERKWANQFGAFVPNNHRIVKIEWLNKRVDVYNLEVEDFHNFIANGVCVSNSSSSPNLLNIPVKTRDGLMIRAGFIPEPGCVFLSNDYSQIELRILAHMSQDKNMMDAFWNNEDLHTKTAKRVYELNGGCWERLSSEMKRYKRLLIKPVNFGIAYGLTASGLFYDLTSQGMDVTIEDCVKFIDNWFDLYPDVYIWLDEVKAEAKRKGMVRDLFGRMRLCPEGWAADKWIKLAGERQAINTPIQSGAAGVTKEAMGQLVSEGVYYDLTEGGKYICRPVLQIHDDIMFEVSEEIYELAAVVINSVMTNAVELSVPIKVDSKYGYNWRDMSKIEM